MFPWRQLGALLADEGLLTPTELELALDEQRRTGRLLGQIRWLGCSFIRCPPLELVTSTPQPPETRMHNVLRNYT